MRRRKRYTIRYTDPPVTPSVQSATETMTRCAPTPAPTAARTARAARAAARAAARDARAVVRIGCAATVASTRLDLSSLTLKTLQDMRPVMESILPASPRERKECDAVRKHIDDILRGCDERHKADMVVRDAVYRKMCTYRVPFFTKEELEAYVFFRVHEDRITARMVHRAGCRRKANCDACLTTGMVDDAPCTWCTEKGELPVAFTS